MPYVRIRIFSASFQKRPAILPCICSIFSTVFPVFRTLAQTKRPKHGLFQFYRVNAIDLLFSFSIFQNSFRLLSSARSASHQKDAGCHSKCSLFKIPVKSGIQPAACSETIVIAFHHRRRNGHCGFKPFQKSCITFRTLWIVLFLMHQTFQRCIVA